MEVLLKKTKITKTILNQTCRSTTIDLKTGEVLGWCFYQGLKYIVIYRSGTKELSKFVLFKDLKASQIDKIDGEHYYKVEVIIGGKYVPITYTSFTKVESDSFIDLLLFSKNKAISMGQFFI